MISPRRRLLNETEAICKVWNVGSLGMKSSDALATALLFELKSKSSFRNCPSCNLSCIVMFREEKETQEQDFSRL